MHGQKRRLDVNLKRETVKELLRAMDDHVELAYYLIDKLIAETIQDDIEGIKNGEYWMIQNGSEESETLSEDWYYDVHGEHCYFLNKATGQKIEVSLGTDKCIENLDPYFFYMFLRSSEKHKHLAEYFEENPFNDMINLFEQLTKEGKMKHVYRNEFRKI
jgi:hypothetical protein